MKMNCSIRIAGMAFGLMIAFGAVRAEAETMEAQKPDTQKAAAATNEFGFTLLKKIAAESPSSENIFISPVSISQALALAYAGAAGQTKDELAAALGAGKPDASSYDEGNLSLMSALKSADPKVKLNIANAIWADRDAPFTPAYKAKCAKYYEAEARSLNFESPAAAGTINSWVNAKTEGKIPTLVSPESVLGAVCVLTNAVYFKGAWSSPFDADETVPAPFTLESGQKIQLDAMHKTASFPTYSNDLFQAISLPYGDSRSVSMVIVLPREGNSAASLLQTMTAKSFDDSVSMLESQRVQLQLPKFHIDYKAGLASPLRGIGIKSAFSSHADFSKMGARPRYISDVIHKSMMDVDEQGTVAAAATGVVMRALAMPMQSPPIPFIVDHPFICAIRDNGTGALLFLGVINHPAELK